MQEQLEAIKSSIKDGQLPKALKELAKLPSQVIRPYKEDILNLQGRLKSAYKQNQSRIVTSEEHNVEVNKIREKCTSLVFEIESRYHKKKDVQKEGNWNIWMIGAAVLCLAAWGLYQNWPQKGSSIGIPSNYIIQANPALDSIFDILIYPFSKIVDNGENQAIGDIHKLLALKLKQEDNINIELVDTIDHNMTPKLAQKIGKEKKMNLVLWGQKSYLQGNPDSILLNIEYETIGRRAFENKMENLYGGATDFKSYNSKDIHTTGLLALPVKDVLKWILANKAFAAQEWNLAARSFENILHESWYPFSEEERVFLLLQAAMAYAQDQQFAKSMAIHRLALELKPNNSRAYLQLGLVYRFKQNLDSALFYLSEAIRWEPNFYVSYNNRAGIYKERKLYQEAIQDYSKAIELDSTFFFGYGNRASVYERDGNPEQALLDYDQAIGIAKKSTEHNYARTLFHSNKASIYLNMAQKIKIEPREVQGSSQYGVTGVGVYLQKARKELDAAEGIGGNEVSSLVAGLHALRSKDYSAALAYFAVTEKIYQLKSMKPPNLAQAYHGRAQIYFLAKEYEQAISASDQAIDILPENPHFYQLRSDSYMKIGDTKKAQEDKKKFYQFIGNQAGN